MAADEVKPATATAGVRTVVPQMGRLGPGPVPCPEARAGDRVSALQGGADGGRILYDAGEVVDVFEGEVKTDGELIQRSRLDWRRVAFIVQLTPAG